MDNYFRGALLLAVLTLTSSWLGCATTRATADQSESSSSTTQQNKATVLQAMDAIMVRRDPTQVDKYFAEPYLQHNPYVPSGVAPLRELIQRAAGNPNARYERVRAIADGDLVAVHGRYTVGPSRSFIAVDLFRLSNGKIVEHWDGLQPEAGPNPSGRTMLDGATEPRDLERTEANRKLVTDFVNAVLVRGEVQRLPEFIDGNAYLQHNPQVADGLSGLGAFMQELKQKGISFHYTRVHRVLAEGDFVVTQSEGELGGKAQAFYDIFRVENGRIAEHWDVIQPVPEKTASGLGMF